MGAYYSAGAWSVKLHTPSNLTRMPTHVGVGVDVVRKRPAYSNIHPRVMKGFTTPWIVAKIDRLSIPACRPHMQTHSLTPPQQQSCKNKCSLKMFKLVMLISHLDQTEVARLKGKIDSLLHFKKQHTFVS